MRAALIACLTLAGLPAAQLPPGQHELLGTWNEQRFWVRLLPAGGPFGQQRLVLMAAAAPLPAAAPGQTTVGDHPWALLDAHARVVAWDERLTGTTVQVERTATGYRRHAIVGDAHGGLLRRDSSWEGPAVAAASHWPLWLALVWQAEHAGELALREILRDDRHGTVRWRGDGTVTLAGPFFGSQTQQLRAEADAGGRLLALRSVAGAKTILRIEQRLPVPPDAVAWAAWQAQQMIEE